MVYYHYGNSRCQQTNGKMERFWRTLRLEFFDKAKITTFDDFKEQLSLYVKHYNFQRPHQGIGGMTPADRFFEIETEVRKRMSRQIAENALEIALIGTVKKPFVMVVRLRNKNGRNMRNRNGRELSTSEAMVQTVKPLIRAKQVSIFPF